MPNSNKQHLIAHPTSHCCNAPVQGEICDGLGTCSKCKEFADFGFNDDDNISDSKIRG